MAGAPRNLAPRNRFSVWIVEPSGFHCTYAFGGTRDIVECRPLLGTLLSLIIIIISSSTSIVVVVVVVVVVAVL